MQKASPSIRFGMSLGDRLRSDVELLKTHWRDRGELHGLRSVLSDLAQYDSLVRRYTGKTLADIRAFEIGYGQAPYRMRALHAAGSDVYGVDAEVPLLSGGSAGYVRILRRNGWERLLKTATRRLLFDRRRDAAFERLLREHGLTPRPVAPHRFLVGDASECQPPGRFDLVYSSAVFEHIERDLLERLVGRIPSWLTRDGVALIVPDVYTGLHGGHLYEWDAQTLERTVNRRSEPWEHLRKRRYTANTTLNGLTRNEYRELFSQSLEILEIIDPPRGREEAFLTPEIRDELRMYSEADLLDETPLFVLGRRRSQHTPSLKSDVA